MFHGQNCLRNPLIYTDYSIPIQYKLLHFIHLHFKKTPFTLCTEYIMKSLEKAVSFKHSGKQMFSSKTSNSVILLFNLDPVN